MCSRRNGKSQCAAVSVHPGIVDTHLARQYFKQLIPDWMRPITDPLNDYVLLPIITRRVEHGGSSVLDACLRPSNEVAGKYTAFGKIVDSGKVSCLINNNM